MPYRSSDMPEHWHRRQWRWRHNGVYGQICRVRGLLRTIENAPSLTYDTQCKLAIAERYLREAAEEAYLRRVEEDGTIVKIKRETVEEHIARRDRQEAKKNKGVVF